MLLVLVAIFLFAVWLMGGGGWVLYVLGGVSWVCGIIAIVYVMVLVIMALQKYVST